MATKAEANTNVESTHATTDAVYALLSTGSDWFQVKERQGYSWQPSVESDN